MIATAAAVGGGGGSGGAVAVSGSGGGVATFAVVCRLDVRVFGECLCAPQLHKFRPQFEYTNFGLAFLFRMWLALRLDRLSRFHFHHHHLVVLAQAKSMLKANTDSY